jgi:DNA-binding MarR family transcriptional regulator
MADQPADTNLDEVVEAVLASSRALVALSARSIASVPGVTLPQYRMLVVLERGSSNLTALARELEVAPSTALRMVDRLIEAGFVDRQTRPENRRETQLSLTPAGRKTVDSVTARRRKALRTVLARIPVRERAAVATAMAAFAAAADPLTNRA